MRVKMRHEYYIIQLKLFLIQGHFSAMLSGVCTILLTQPKSIVNILNPKKICVGV